MRFLSLIILLSSVFLMSSTQVEREHLAIKQIKELKNGALLVRLHTNDVMVQKLKEVHRDRDRKYLIQEIYDENMSMYRALSGAYKFSRIEFFFSRDSDKVRAKDFDNIFLNDSLQMDPTIKVDPSANVFILEVGDIYFEHMAGHMEGVVVMDDKFVQLNKPFPFYVRKRSGMVIIKRTDLDIAVILNRKLKEFHAKNLLRDVG